MFGASLAVLAAGCAPTTFVSVPTEEPLPTDTPQPTVTPIPPPPLTSTPFPTPTPAPYSVTWQDISPPVSLDFKKPANNYGIVSLAIDPKDFATLYAGSCNQGLWKTSDGGGKWTKVNTGRNHEALDSGRLWTLAIDPVDPRVLYTAVGYGYNGVWKSVNGGVDWDGMLTPDIVKAFGTDIMFINVNPLNHLQLLAGYHRPLADQSPILLISGDGGATWRVLGHDVPWGGGEGQQGYFLSNTKYLVTTPGAGYWLSLDAGATWKQVSKVNSNAYNQPFQAPNGTLFSGGSDGLQVSRDGGMTWQEVHPASGPFETVIGLGDFLFTAPALAGDKLGTPYFVSPLTDGYRWRLQTTQRFPDGPNRLAADPQHLVLYSSNGNSGVWKLQLRP